MLTVSELVAKFPTDRDIDQATVAQLRVYFKGRATMATATKATFKAIMEELRRPDYIEAEAESAVSVRAGHVANLCAMSPEEVSAWFVAQQYQPHTVKKYLTLLERASYPHMPRLREATTEMVLAAKIQDSATLAERHKTLPDAGATEKWVLECYRLAKTLLAKPNQADPWDLVLGLQLVTGRRHSEIASMSVRNGAFVGKAKGRAGQYDGVWFPLFIFGSEEAVNKALAIVQAECGPNQTEAQRVKWNRRLTERLELWPAAPFPVTPKVFRKVYGAVASALPSQFPMPVEWPNMSIQARTSWLCGHSEGDLNTQLSYTLFDCDKATAKKVLALLKR